MSAQAEMVGTRNVKNKVAFSTAAQLVSQAITALTGAVVLKIMTNSLGSNSYGIYVTSLAFVTMFSLLTDLGVNSLTSREIARRPKDATDIVGHNMGLRIALSIIMIPAITLLGLLFYPDAPAELRNGILILSAYLLFDSIRSTIFAYYLARIRGHLSAIIGASQQLLFLALVVGAAVLGVGIYGFLVAYLSSFVAGATISLYIARRSVGTRPRANFAKWRIMLGKSMALGIIMAINIVYLKVDSVMISIFMSPENVGYYSVAYSALAVATVFPSIMMSSMIPILTKAKDGEYQKAMQQCVDIIFIASMFVATIGIIMSHRVVTILSSESFVNAAAPLSILLVGSIFSGLNAVLGFAAVSRNKHSKIIPIAIINLVLNLVINLYTIPKFGIIGAAWATTITEFVSLILVYALMRRALNVKLRIHRLARIFVPVCGTAALAKLLGLTNSGGSVLFTLFGLVLLSVSFILFATIIGALPGSVRGGFKLKAGKFWTP